MGLRIITDTHTIDVPQAIEAEGAQAVEQWVAEEIALAEAKPVASPSNPPDSQTAGADS